ncbi:MAG: regulatory iron-sulfur-containing complex subunit RicT [Elusimicrobia bacterium]|nr:regulatory iron-sulfur-containing complex subunit RicT [Elusimicrobiota bacterium]
MPLAVGVQVRKTKDIIYCDAGSIDVSMNDRLLVETENGLEAGVVVIAEQMINTKEPLKKLVRLFTEEDAKQVEENKIHTKKVLPVILDKMQALKLKMSLSMIEYTFERIKLFIYYTAEERVDFRELIKELGAVLKTRIQMVQIGVRDEVKILGSLGHCGEICCCQRFLKDFTSVTTDMAKEQNLTINPAKISGVCGRLICCIAYEHGFYVSECKKFPKVDSSVKIAEGKGRVIGVDIFKSQVTVKLEDDRIKKIGIKDIIK